MCTFAKVAKIFEWQIKPEHGDCNSDGEFNVADVLILQKYVLAVSNTQINSQAADLNSDGNIDVFDIIAIRKLITENAK